VDRMRRFPLGEATDDLEKVLRLRLASRPQEPAQQRNRQRQLGRNWASALDAVQQAADVLRSTEQHAADIEARGVALAERALGELKQAELRIHAAEEAMQAMEARAQEAEARAAEAEEWLSRLHQAIHDRLLTRRPERLSAAA
jgi:hypothetical protein